jgi:hypothetical protein
MNALLKSKFEEKNSAGKSKPDEIEPTPPQPD